MYVYNNHRHRATGHLQSIYYYLKEETAEHTVGYQPKPDNRVWFDEE